jgi:hypothetical protein
MLGAYPARDRREAAPVRLIGDQLRLELLIAVSWGLDLDLRFVGVNPFALVAIAGVSAVLVDRCRDLGCCALHRVKSAVTFCRCCIFSKGESSGVPLKCAGHMIEQSRREFAIISILSIFQVALL